MNPKNELLPIQPGTMVRVSNGQPRPPERFKNKLKAWESENYDAVVVGERGPDRWVPVPEYRIQKAKYLSGFMLVFATAPAEKVTPIENAPTYRVEVQGMDAVVTGVQA